MTEDTVALKRALRAQIRARREAQTIEERAEASRGFARNLASITPGHRPVLVACYLSTPGEPSTRPYLEWATASGVEVLVPISRSDGLMDWVDVRGQAEAEGLFGIFELTGDRRGPEALGLADLIIVPAAAVDRSGMRMGWGRGYFDKALSSLTALPRPAGPIPVYALVHDDEVVDSLPAEPHDLPVSGVVTPTRVLSFGARA